MKPASDRRLARWVAVALYCCLGVSAYLAGCSRGPQPTSPPFTATYLSQPTSTQAVLIREPPSPSPTPNSYPPPPSAPLAYPALITLTPSGVGRVTQPTFTSLPSPFYPPPGLTAEGTLTPTPTPYPVLFVTPAPFTLPFFQVIDIAFVDAVHGWALGNYRASANDSVVIALRRTTDGGRTWNQIAAPHQSSQSVDQLRFANVRDGWAFGPGLFATHDGGRTWINESPQADVVGLETAGETVWAIERLCPGTPGACAFRLVVSPVAGGGWQSAQVQPPGFGQLVRPNAMEAWILTLPGEGDQLHIGLISTHDGGLTWVTAPEPPPDCGPNGSLALDESRHLWLLCNSGPATIMEPKTLYRSSDAGQHWAQIADTSPDRVGVGTLPMIGAVTDFAAVSDRRAFIGMSRSTLARTDDGGYTWVFPLAFDADVMAGIKRVVFADTLHGWAATWENLVFLTVDGGIHWDVTTVQ